VDQLMTNG